MAKVEYESGIELIEEAIRNRTLLGDGKLRDIVSDVMLEMHRTGWRFEKGEPCQMQAIIDPEESAKEVIKRPNFAVNILLVHSTSPGDEIIKLIDHMSSAAMAVFIERGEMLEDARLCSVFNTEVKVEDGWALTIEGQVGVWAPEQIQEYVKRAGKRGAS